MAGIGTRHDWNPKGRLSATLAGAAFLLWSGTASAADVIDRAAGHGEFSGFVAAVQAAGLVDTLKGAGPFTVLAPTDDALSRAEARMDELMEPGNEAELAALLRRHVIRGKVMSADLSEGTSPPTLEGGALTVALEDGPVIGGANVVTADMEADNGVVHGIDALLD